MSWGVGNFRRILVPRSKIRPCYYQLPICSLISMLDWTGSFDKRVPWARAGWDEAVKCLLIQAWLSSSYSQTAYLQEAHDARTHLPNSFTAPEIALPENVSSEWDYCCDCRTSGIWHIHYVGMSFRQRNPDCEEVLKWERGKKVSGENGVVITKMADWVDGILSWCMEWK